jgi:hypothetical protein
MTFSAGSGRNQRPTRRNRPGQSASAAAPRTAARSTRSTDRTTARTKATPANRHRRSTRADRAFQGKLQPMVLPSHLPGWLQSLMQVQRGIWVGTIVLSTVALGTYGWSVYSQQQWGMAYKQLQQLQRNERQLISGNEMLKNQIAQQVDPKALGLAPQKADDVIFIKPTTGVAAKPDSDDVPPAPTDRAQPLGY